MTTGVPPTAVVLFDFRIVTRCRNARLGRPAQDRRRDILGLGRRQERHVGGVTNEPPGVGGGRVRPLADHAPRRVHRPHVPVDRDQDILDGTGSAAARRPTAAADDVYGVHVVRLVKQLTVDGSPGEKLMSSLNSIS